MLEGEFEGGDLLRFALGQIGDSPVIDLIYFVLGFARSGALIGLAVLGHADGFGDIRYCI